MAVAVGVGTSGRAHESVPTDPGSPGSGVVGRHSLRDHDAPWRLRGRRSRVAGADRASVGAADHCGSAGGFCVRPRVLQRSISTRRPTPRESSHRRGPEPLRGETSASVSAATRPAWQATAALLEAAVAGVLRPTEEEVVAAMRTSRPAGLLLPAEEEVVAAKTWLPAECLPRPGPSLLAGAEAMVRVARAMAGARLVPCQRLASASSQPEVRPEHREAHPSSIWEHLRRDPAGTGDPGSSRRDAAWVRRSGESSRPVGPLLETPSREHPGLGRGPGHDHRD